MTDKIYATIDNDGEYILEDAVIFAFDTQEEAEEYILRPWQDLESGETLTIEAGRYGDCWSKYFDEPMGFAPFTLDEVLILRPGRHPGGRKWWVTPYPEVLIAFVE